MSTSDPAIILGEVQKWADHIRKSMNVDPVDKPRWKYYIKCIGPLEARERFANWFEQNINAEYEAAKSQTRRSARYQYFFNCDDFAMLVKLSWETFSEY